MFIQRYTFILTAALYGTHVSAVFILLPGAVGPRESMLAIENHVATGTQAEG